MTSRTIRRTFSRPSVSMSKHRAAPLFKVLVQAHYRMEFDGVESEWTVEGRSISPTADVSRAIDTATDAADAESAVEMGSDAVRFCRKITVSSPCGRMETTYSV